MKKLTKLGISPEKIMKNEDLINLQGGYGNHTVYCKDYSGTICTLAYYTCDTQLVKNLCLESCPGSNSHICI